MDQQIILCQTLTSVHLSLNTGSYLRFSRDRKRKNPKIVVKLTGSQAIGDKQVSKAYVLWYGWIISIWEKITHSIFTYYKATAHLVVWTTKRTKFPHRNAFLLRFKILSVIMERDQQLNLAEHVRIGSKISFGTISNRFSVSYFGDL